MAETRMPIISGNWKMNLNHLEAIQLVQKLAYELDAKVFDSVEVSIHPPFTDIRSIQTLIDADRLHFKLGAQNCHTEASGAFTGEVSPAMLAKLAVSYVIVGHSERRQMFGETDDLVNAKARAVFEHGMTPIVCVGETLDEREAGAAEAKVSGQVKAALTGLTSEQVRQVVIAYEPIWAIGTGKTALPADAQAMCAVIREVLGSLDATAPEVVRVQYGGSVNPGTIGELMAKPDIDGALVGGASLEADSFGRIVRYGD